MNLIEAINRKQNLEKHLSEVLKEYEKLGWEVGELDVRMSALHAGSYVLEICVGIVMPDAVQ